MATNYTRGRNFEYKTRDDLEERGYYVVRSAGSHSKVDLLAVKGDIAIFVQCKSDGNISPGEWAMLYKICAAPNFLPVVASTFKGKVVYHLIDSPTKPVKGKWIDFDPGEKVVN